MRPRRVHLAQSGFDCRVARLNPRRRLLGLTPLHPPHRKAQRGDGNADRGSGDEETDVAKLVDHHP